MQTITIISVPAHLPVPYRPSSRIRRGSVNRSVPAELPSEGAFIAACTLLARRGAGPKAWATPFRDSPIAFLLDTIGDAVRLWGPDGRIVFRNASSAERDLDMPPPHGASHEALTLGGRRYERRCQPLTHDGATYVLEVVHPLRD